MARLKPLERELARLFSTPKPKKTDTTRGSRTKAKALAAAHGIEIERVDGGMNVWPPSTVSDAADPFAGDHYCNDWSEALSMAEAYAKLAEASPK